MVFTPSQTVGFTSQVQLHQCLFQTNYAVNDSSYSFGTCGLKGWICHRVDVYCDFRIMSGCHEEPVELPEEPEPTDGPSVPFRLTEAKLGHEQTGDQPYFGRINMKACVARDSVHLYVYVYVHRQTDRPDQTGPDQTRPDQDQDQDQTRPDQTRQIQTNIQNTNVYIYI